MKILVVFVCILAAIILIVWLGLQVKPKSFAPFASETPKLQTIPLPADLPEPVERFYRERYGDTIPVIDTAVISGRGTLKLGSIPLPIRFRFVHEAGKNFRSDIDMTFFGMPIMHAYETYLDGHGRGVTPGGAWIPLQLPSLSSALLFRRIRLPLPDPVSRPRAEQCTRYLVRGRFGRSC